MCNKTPFPQANDLNKIMLYVCYFKYKTTSNLMKEINVTSTRQLSYYRDAAIFLGFIANVNGKYHSRFQRVNIKFLQFWNFFFSKLGEKIADLIGILQDAK